MEMTTEPKTVESQAPKTIRIGREYVIKPSKVRIIIELEAGMEIDPKWQSDIDDHLEDLACAIETAAVAFTHD